MRQSVQRAAVEDIVPVKRPLRIFILLIPLARSEGPLAALRIRSETPATNRMSTDLKKNALNDMKIRAIIYKR